MKTLKSYIIGAMAIVAAGAFTACQDHFDEPNSEQAPVAAIEANTSIAELKELIWKTSDNYCTQIYTKEWYAADSKDRTEEMKTEGTHIIVSGRVVSSDYAGNCFKYIVLQDETGAINFSIDSYNLYLMYRRGQEVVVDLTGMHGGKYRGLLQIGFPSYNSSINGDETSFMGPQIFRRHAELNGFPERAKIDTVTVDRISDLGVTPAELRKWQSQLIRINNVAFVADDVPTLSEYHSSGVSHNIQDAEGNTIAIRTSGYANFWNMNVPEGRGDIVAILGYYATIGQTGAWQLTLLDAASLMNFGNPTVPSGSEGNPYTVQQAIALQANGDGATGWVKGYIVGTVAPEIENVTSSSDVEWTAEPTLGNTMVVAPDPECTDVAQCLVIALPQGSALRTQGALRENPDNYKKEIKVRGTMQSVMSTFGLSTPGAAADFAIEGQIPTPSEGVPDGDGQEATPYNVAQVIAKAPTDKDNALESGVWVKGFIVGSCTDKSYSSAEFGATATSSETNMLLAPAADCTNASLCIPVALPASVRAELNLRANPGNLGKLISIKGNIIKYFGVPGVKDLSQYVFDGETPDVPVPGTPEGDGTAANPYNATAALDLAKSLAEGQEVEAYAKGTVASITEINVDFGNATYTITDGSSKLSVFRGSYLNGDKFTSADQLKVGDEVVVSGKLVNYKGNTPQFTTGSKLVSINGQGNNDPVNPPTPPTPSDCKGNFDSFNNSTANSKYGTYTNATGWTLENGAVLSGQAEGVADTNPRFGFIGGTSTLAPTLNGKVGSVGKLTSPVLNGGCGTLTFNYGFAFAETKAQFTVNVLQGGTVVKSQTVTVDPLEQKHAYDFSMEVNVTGDFSIEIVNDCLTQSTSGNKDRVSIWNLTWTE